jgi:phytol kinase
MLTQRDIIALVLSYVYAFGLLLFAEMAGRLFRWPQYITRKLVHIGAGMWVWGTLALFESRLGILPYATFIVLNYLFYRYQVFKAMDAADSSPGTIYFAVSTTALLVLLWHPNGPIDRAPVAIAAIMAMTWGDGVASIVGQAFGQHAYRALGHQRTWEGTAAMFICSLVGIFLTLTLLPGSQLSPESAPIPLARALFASVLGAGLGTVAEGLSPAGTDNLSVPILTGIGLFALLG